MTRALLIIVLAIVCLAVTAQPARKTVKEFIELSDKDTVSMPYSISVTNTL